MIYVIKKNGEIVQEAYVIPIKSVGKDTNKSTVVYRDLSFKTESKAMEDANVWVGATVVRR